MGEPDDQPRAERVRAAVEAAIVEHRYPPGARLVEDEIGRELGVSRTPVREAFRSLEQAGWIEVRPRAGAHVRMPRIDEARQDFELRHELEGLAARWAAQRATEGQLRELDRVVSRGLAAAARGDEKALLALNDRFYGLLVEAAGNLRLEVVLRDLSKRIRWYFHHLVGRPTGHNWDEHKVIAEAVRAGDAERAEQLVAEHSRHWEAEFLGLVLGPSSSLAFGPISGPAAPRRAR
ncbi:MAG: GntR family transcriptional regulator [Acidimicrobiia bacterium]